MSIATEISLAVYLITQNNVSTSHMHGYVRSIQGGVSGAKVKALVRRGLNHFLYVYYKPSTNLQAPVIISKGGWVV